MALTVSDVVGGPPLYYRGQPIGQAGDQRNVFKIVDITFDSSYAGSGGEALVAADVGLAVITRVIAPPKGGYVFSWASDKLAAYWVDTTTDGAPMAEVTAATDLATITTRALVYGTT